MKIIPTVQIGIMKMRNSKFLLIGKHQIMIIMTMIFGSVLWMLIRVVVEKPSKLSQPPLSVTLLSAQIIKEDHHRKIILIISKASSSSFIIHVAVKLWEGVMSTPIKNFTIIITNLMDQCKINQTSFIIINQSNYFAIIVITNEPACYLEGLKTASPLRLTVPGKLGRPKRSAWPLYRRFFLILP